MGNLLSTEDLGNEQEHDEPVKQEKKKRRGKAKTAKRREEPRVTDTEGFSLFSDPGEPLEEKDDVIESLNLESEYREPSKAKRKKRSSTVSRRRKVAWEDEDFE